MNIKYFRLRQLEIFIQNIGGCGDIRDISCGTCLWREKKGFDIESAGGENCSKKDILPWAITMLRMEEFEEILK